MSKVGFKRLDILRPGLLKGSRENDLRPGEMLFVASAKAAPLVDESVIDRCETEHIRRLMAQVGWDWSVLMNIGAIRPENTAQLIATHGTPARRAPSSPAKLCG